MYFKMTINEIYERKIEEEDKRLLLLHQNNEKERSLIEQSFELSIKAAELDIQRLLEKTPSEYLISSSGDSSFLISLIPSWDLDNLTHYSLSLDVILSSDATSNKGIKIGSISIRSIFLFSYTDFPFQNLFNEEPSRLKYSSEVIHARKTKYCYYFEIVKED